MRRRVREKQRPIPRRLRTERVDLLQFHAIQYADDPERVFDPERGGMKAAFEAKKTGKVRFFGFSGHRAPETHLRMIGMHPWDSVQMPLNLLDTQYRSVETAVLPVCREKGTGALGMKSRAGQDAWLPRGRIARDFKPLRAADVEPLLAAARGAAQEGHIEEYKDPKSGYGCSYQDAVLKGA